MERPTDDIHIDFSPPPVAAYLALRARAGLGERSVAAAERGLPRSLFAVSVYQEESLIAMGRVVGDGGCNFEVVDIAVEPNQQGQGLGRKVMEHVMNYLEANAPCGSYICLIAAVPDLYRKFGFQPCAPKNEGMFIKR